MGDPLAYDDLCRWNPFRGRQSDFLRHRTPPPTGSPGHPGGTSEDSACTHRLDGHLRGRRTRSDPELVLTCALTPKNLADCLALLERWITKERVGSLLDESSTMGSLRRSSEVRSRCRLLESLLPQINQGVLMMNSPFPGMDPYLEQHWGGVHLNLISYAEGLLNEHLPRDLPSPGLKSA